MIQIKQIKLRDIIENPDNYNTSNHNVVDDYLDYIKQFDTKYWIDKFHKYEKITISNQTDIKLLWEMLKLSNINKKFPMLYEEDLDDLTYKYQKMYLNTNLDNKFVRTEKTSLKTGCYGIGPYNSLKDILKSTATTKFGHHAFNQDDKEINIYLMKYEKIDISKEFRVFVVDNKISCISQQNIYEKSYYLISHPNLTELVEKLNLYFENNVKDKLAEYKNYIMDIALNERNEFYFIEINPFGKNYTSGSACFHWINDHQTIMDNSFIEFRYVV